MKNQLAYPLRLGVIFGIGLLVLGISGKTWAHVFPDHSAPPVGSIQNTAPKMVQVWFDGYIEPAFSTIEVYDKNDQRVDKQDGHVNELDPTLLEVGLTKLSFGVYRVVWIAVSVDGHRTEGDFRFTVAEPKKSP